MKLGVFAALLVYFVQTADSSNCLPENKFKLVQLLQAFHKLQIQEISCLSMQIEQWNTANLFTIRKAIAQTVQLSFSNDSDLAAKSEYFRILFESGFAEKKKKTIELKEITAKNFEQFMIVIENPENFKATTTLAYFNYTEPLTIILNDPTKFNKVPMKDLLESARTHGVSEITEIVEDWCLVCFDQSPHSRKFEQLQFSVEYGMITLETRLLDYFINDSIEFLSIVYRVVLDNSELGKKVYEKFNASVFDAFSKGEKDDDCCCVLADFVSKMRKSQFESVKEDVENMVVAKLQKMDHEDIVFANFLHLETFLIQKLDKVKTFVTEHYLETFASSFFQYTMAVHGVQYGLNQFTELAIDFLIADFPSTHNWKTIDSAVEHEVVPLKVFLKKYLRKNYANLSKPVKKEMEKGKHSLGFLIDVL